MPAGHRAGPAARWATAIDAIDDSYQDFGAGQFIWRLGDPAVEGYVAASDPRRDGQAAGLLRHGAAVPGAAPALWPGLLLAMAGAIAFSGKAIIVKLAYRHGVDAVTLIMCRMLFALPLFLALAWWAGRGKPALTRARLARRSRGWASAATTWRASSTSAGLQYISASLERLILYLNPTLVLLLGRGAVQAPRARRGSCWRWPSATPACCWSSATSCSSQAPTRRSAPALVFASALSYAVYLVLQRRGGQRLGALRLTGLATTRGLRAVHRAVPAAAAAGRRAAGGAARCCGCRC